MGNRLLLSAVLVGLFAIAAALVAGCAGPTQPSTTIRSPVVSITPPASFGAPWPMVGHDAQRTGQSPFTGPAAPEQLWTVPIGGYSSASPVVGADGTVYAGSSDGRLLAINSDGTTKWTFETDGSLVFPPAVGSDGTVYAGTAGGDLGAGGTLYALNPDGTPRWRYDVGDQCGPVTVGADGTVYASAGTGDGSLTAVAADGRAKWVFRGVPEWGGLFRPSAAVIGEDGTVYVAASSEPLEFGDVGHLFALSPDGTVEWQFTATSMTYAPAVAPDGTIYVFSNDDGVLHAIDPGGSEKWTFEAGQVHGSPGIGADGTVYFVSDGGWIYALRPDGTKKWALGGYYVESEPVIGGDGTLYFARTKLVAVAPDGSLRWTALGEDRWYAPPVIGGDGVLYVMGETSLVAVGERR